MIKISCPSIDFLKNEKTKDFTIANTGEVQMLYKIRTNNVKALDARPNTGSIQPSETLKITVRRIEQHLSSNVKLQISWLQCAQQLTDENFRQLWNKYEKDNKRQTLAVRVVKEQEPNHLPQVQRNDAHAGAQNQLQTEPTSRPEPKVQNPDIQEQASQLPQEALRSPEKQQKQPKSPMRFFQSQTIVKSKTQQLVQQNQNLKKKLKEKDDQIEKLQKTQINAPKEPKDENNKFAVFIAYFVIFILGYYFGLYSASSDENYDGNNANVTNTNIGDF